jgi:outer membrane protein
MVILFRNLFMILKMKKIIFTLAFSVLMSSLNLIAQSDSAIVTLSQCINAALNNNPLIKQASNEVVAAKFALKIAESGYYPVISTDISAGFSDQYRLNNNYKTGNVSLSADQPLWQKGKIKAFVAQAKYTQEAENYSLESQTADLIESVKATYLNCQMQFQLNLISIDNVNRSRLFLEYARERYKTGTGRKSDVLKAESDLSEAEFDSEKNRYLLVRLQNELSRLTGLSPLMFSKLEDTLRCESAGKFNNDFDSLKATVFLNYPDLKIVYNQELSQQARIDEAKAELYPRLGLNTGYSWSYNPALPEQKGWFTGFTLRWRLSSGNELRNRIQLEMTKKIIYENRKDEIKDFLVKELNNRLNNLREAQSQIKMSDRMIMSTSENLEIAIAQYNAGTGSMLELTDARINDLNAREKNIRAITAFQIALVNLERLTNNMNQYHK